jgi:hypothetical protein
VWHSSVSALAAMESAYVWKKMSCFSRIKRQAQA